MRLRVALLLVAITASASAQTRTPGQQTPARATPARDQQPATGTARISGQVVDATTGAPIRRVLVSAYGPELRNTTRNAMTDVEGRFEIRDLPAGKHTVSASRTGYLRALFGQRRLNGPGTPIEILDRQVVDKVVIPLTRGGAITGRVMDEFGEAAPGVELRALQYRFEGGSRKLMPVNNGMMSPPVTDDLGAFRLYGLEPGQFIISAQPREAMYGAAAIAGDSTGPTITYFPNTPDAATAQRVRVVAGRETSNVIITLASAKLSHVRGRAIMSNGEPFAGTFVNVTVRDAGGSWGRSSGMTLADGSFEIKGLTPATYQLSVRPNGAREQDDVEVGRLSLTVAGDDIDGILIVGGKPGIARGRVMTDEGVPMPYFSMSITAHGLPPEDRFGWVTPGRVKEDHTFELKGLFGPRLLRFGGFATAAPSPDMSAWMLKAVMLNGVDIIDTPIDFQPGQVVEGIEMVFSRRFAELSGSVTSERGVAIQENWVVLFPADESRWSAQSRFVRVARPDTQGHYRIGALPAHDDYLLAAVPELEPGQYADPEFLRSVRDQASRLALSDGEKKVQNLRLLQTR